MNIFTVSPCPIECAEALDDKRLGKMIIETNQLISNAYFLSPVSGKVLEQGEGKLCKITHKGHPCTKWACLSSLNANWLIVLSAALSNEYRYRFGKEHGSSKRTDYFIEHLYRADLGQPIYFPNCAKNKELGLDFTYLDVYDAYKEYLSARWELDKRPPKWTNRSEPIFYRKHIA